MSMTDRDTTWLAAAAHATAEHHHLGMVVAHQLLANFQLALTTDQRPYFTHTNLARRRGVRHRNTSRRIIASLESAGLLMRTRYRKIRALGHANFSLRWGNIYAYVRHHHCRRMAPRPGTLAPPASSSPLVVPRTVPAPQRRPVDAPMSRAQADTLRTADTTSARSAALAAMRESLFGAPASSTGPEKSQI